MVDSCLSGPIVPDQPETNHPPKRGVSYTKPIDAAKEAVSVLDLAERLCGDLKAVGSRYEGHCPLPDHDDKSPSFNAYPETQSWWCFGCSRGGDVVDLYALSNGHEHLGEAAGFLLLEFGHEVPQRPASWHRKQSRQQKIREQIDREKVEHIRLLVFRLIWIPWLKRLPEAVGDEAAKSAWEMSRSMALSMYERGRGL